MLKKVTLLTAVLAILIAAKISPQSKIPQLINFQGFLTDSTGAPLADSTYNVIFRIHSDPTGPLALWSENQNVLTNEGLFSVQLGKVTPLDIDDIFFDSVKYLGVTVEPFSEMLPRSRFVTTPYSQNANRVTTIDGAVGGQVSGNIQIIPGTLPDGQFEIQGTNPMGFYAGLTGNSSVTLPDSSISSSEEFNEPGIASIHWTGVPFELTTTMTDLCTLSVTIPASGYILLLGATRIDAGNTGTGNLVYVQIDETQGGAFDYSSLAFQAGGTLPQVGSVSPQRVYIKGAGTHKFRLEAMKGSASSSSFCTLPVLTAIYFPTAYGFVGTTQ